MHECYWLSKICVIGVLYLEIGLKIWLHQHLDVIAPTERESLFCDILVCIIVLLCVPFWNICTELRARVYRKTIQDALCCEAEIDVDREASNLKRTTSIPHWARSVSFFKVVQSSRHDFSLCKMSWNRPKTPTWHLKGIRTKPYRDQSEYSRNNVSLNFIHTFQYLEIFSSKETNLADFKLFFGGFMDTKFF